MAVSTTERPAHAKSRPPSAAHRWLACHASAHVVPMYPNDESDASKKGDIAHGYFENAIRFGVLPDTDDPDMDLNVRGAYEWVQQQKLEYGPKCVVYAEQQYDIPQTGEWGTADVTFVSPEVLHIADYKNGYVPVEIKINAQMMVYLLGAIAKYGPRKKYLITVIQPNYNHIDGPYRTWQVSDKDLEWFETEVIYACHEGFETRYHAGEHCKKTYCPHRGACVTFNDWAKSYGALAYYPSEINALGDEQLAEALDHADTLQGLRDELRKEAMRRMLNMDRAIPGYKIVKSRQDRAFASDDAREEVFKACQELGASPEDLYKKTPESVAGVEKFIKQIGKRFGQGKWKDLYDNVVQPHVRDFSGSLTLERAIDGRPAHSRGSEFGAIQPAQPSPTQVGQVTII